MEINKLNNTQSVQTNSQPSTAIEQQHDNKYVGEILTTGEDHSSVVGRSMIKAKGEKVNKAEMNELKSMLKELGEDKRNDEILSQVTPFNIDFVTKFLSRLQERIELVSSPTRKPLVASSGKRTLNEILPFLNPHNKQVAMDFLEKGNTTILMEMKDLWKEINSPEKLKFFNENIINSPQNPNKPVCFHNRDCNILIEKNEDGIDFNYLTTQNLQEFYYSDNSKEQDIADKFQNSISFSIENAGACLKHLNKHNKDFVKEIIVENPEYIDITRHLKTKKDVQLARKIMEKQESSNTGCLRIDACFRKIRDLEYVLQEGLGLNKQKANQLYENIVDMLNSDIE